jgi:hypothetical protein
MDYPKRLFKTIFCTETSTKDTSFVTSMSEGPEKQYVKVAESLKLNKGNSIKTSY